MGAFFKIIWQFVENFGSAIGAFFTGIGQLFANLNGMFLHIAGTPLGILPTILALGMAFIVARILVHLL